MRIIDLPQLYLPVMAESNLRAVSPWREGLATLSLSASLPQVFPQLYLPVMAESNLRAVRPWREWLPTPSAWRHTRCLSALNGYIRRILRERWRARAKGAASAKPDILDRLLASIEARLSGLVSKDVRD